MGNHRQEMKLLLCVAIALFAGAALATKNSEYPDAVVDGVEVFIEESAWESASPETDLMEVHIEASFDEAKASVAQLLQAGKTDAACPNQAKDDKPKADKAEKAALDAVNAAKGAKINFGDYVVSSLKEGDCNPFYTSTVWKNAQKKIKDAEAVYTTKKAEAAAAAKAVTAAEEEARKLVKKCKCESKTAIEKAIKDINAKAKDANQKAWTKSYHMICVLDAKPANNCPVPALPEVKPVPFGQGVLLSCANDPDYCHTGYEAYMKAGHSKRAVQSTWTSSGNVKTGGFTNTAKHFKLVKLSGSSGWDQSKAQMDRYVNMCLQAGYQAVGCGSSKNWDSSVCSTSIAMPNNWGCNMLNHLTSKLGSNVIALQEKIGNNAGLYTSNGQPSAGTNYFPVCGKQI